MSTKVTPRQRTQIPEIHMCPHVHTGIHALIHEYKCEKLNWLLANLHAWLPVPTHTHTIHRQCPNHPVNKNNTVLL